MISGFSSRLFQPYTCPTPGPIRDEAPESSPFLKLPDIPSRQYADLRNHPDFQAIKTRFLSDIDEMDELATGFVGNIYRDAIHTFRSRINNPPENIERGLFAIFDETRLHIHKIVARMKAFSSGECAAPADSTPEQDRDRITQALHICLNEIDHCPAGVQSRFSRACRSLEAEPEQLNGRLFLIRKTLLEEFSHTFLRQVIQEGVMDIRSGDEIHWINALFNAVCSQFGLDTIADPMATRQISPDIMDRFHSQLPQALNEYTVLHALACDYYQRFCHFLDSRNLSRWRTEPVPAGKLTSDHMDDLQHAIITPMNQLCDVQEREKAISLGTLIESDGDQYSFARCREMIHGWLTRTVMDAPASLFTRIPGPPDGPQRCIGTCDNLFFWIFEAECPLALDAVWPFDAEGVKPLTISDLSTIDVCSWPEPVQLALLSQAMEQTGVTSEDGQSVAVFILGKESGKTIEHYPVNVQNTVASQLTGKMTASHAFASGLVAALSPSFTGSIPDWVFKTPLLELLLVSPEMEESVIRATADKLTIWQLINFSPASLKRLFTPDRCQNLFQLALNQELGGLLSRLLQTGYCDAMKNHANPDTNSVLMVLCGQGITDGVTYLVNTLQDTDVNSRNTTGATALHFAARYGHTECLEKLLARDDIALNGKTNIEWTALHYAARYGHTECLDKLLARDDIALNEKSNIGCTALHYAVRYDHTECLVKLMTRAGIALNAKTSEHWTALHIAARNGYTECLKKLLATNRIALNEANYKGLTALHFAAGNGHAECLYSLLTSNNIALNGKSLAGFTALHFAAGNGRTKCLRILLQIPSVRVNVRNRYGFTPLMEAAVKGRTDCIQLLLNHRDTALNIMTIYGNSAQHLARAHQHQDIVNMLENDHRYNRLLNGCFWYLCCGYRL